MPSSPETPVAATEEPYTPAVPRLAPFDMFAAQQVSLVVVSQYVASVTLLAQQVCICNST